MFQSKSRMKQSGKKRSTALWTVGSQTRQDICLKQIAGVSHAGVQVFDQFKEDALGHPVTADKLGPNLHHFLTVSHSVRSRAGRCLKVAQIVLPPVVASPSC